MSVGGLRALANVIARWQPAASDWRLLMAALKCAANLERVGDEARKIAKRTRRIAMDAGAWEPQHRRIKTSGQMASHMLRGALDAFARMDATAAAQIVRDDEAIDAEFRAFVVKLVESMKENPRTIPIGLDYLFIAKSIERIGDHATILRNPSSMPFVAPTFATSIESSVDTNSGNQGGDGCSRGRVNHQASGASL